MSCFIIRLLIIINLRLTLIPRMHVFPAYIHEALFSLECRDQHRSTGTPTVTSGESSTMSTKTQRPPGSMRRKSEPSLRVSTLSVSALARWWPLRTLHEEEDEEDQSPRRTEEVARLSLQDHTSLLGAQYCKESCPQDENTATRDTGTPTPKEHEGALENDDDVRAVRRQNTFNLYTTSVRLIILLQHLPASVAYYTAELTQGLFYIAQSHCLSTASSYSSSFYPESLD